MEVIEINDEEYPKLLKTIKDPPQRLYCEGDTGLLNRVSVSVVGSRKATGYGLRVAENTAGILSGSGICVVSGLAFGIDCAAHKGALEGRGKTIAVLGSSIDMEKTEKKKALFRKIKETGLVISEYPPKTPATRYSFPRRNRIISGLSVATVVVEAGLYSGSLITAELAEEQGRDVYAVPGNVDSVTSMGTNRLIKDGASILLNPYDICQEAGIQRRYTQVLGHDEQKIADILADGREHTVAEIASVSGFSREQVKGITGVLVMKGMACMHSGKIFIL